MGEEESLKVVEALENALRSRDLEAFANLHAEDVLLHAPDRPEPYRGREAIKEWYGGFVNGFPDMDVKAERLFAQGEWVCGEYRVKGTHTGELPGPAGGDPIPPTHKAVDMASATVYRVQGGKVKEVSEYFDQLGFLAQLGLLPENE